jgi:succinate dehydrogenase / fumarate reductase cytochrome b subunit
MALSILHRATGMANAVGLIVLAAWLVAIAGGEADYARFAGLMSSLVGRLLLIAWSFSFFYHLSNGVRHLFWDAGYGFEKAQANASAWFVITLATVLTAGFWLMLP